MTPDFRRYWFGQAVSSFGSSVTRFALPLAVYKLTGSAMDLSVATAVSYLPYLLFGLLIGAGADRVDRKRMMIAADLGRALIIASLPLQAFNGTVAVEWIYLVGFVNSTLSICFETGQFGAIPSLVDREGLVAANGRIQASYSLAQVLGPLVAGLLVPVIPIWSLFLIDAASFVVSAGSLALVRTRFDSGERRGQTHLGRDILDGMRYVFSHPVLRNISLMMALVNFIGSTTNAQILVFAKRQFHADDLQVSFLYAAASAGTVVLSLAAGPLRARWSFSAVALSALMLQGLSVLALASAGRYWQAVSLWAIASGLGVLFNINTGSLRQAIVPDHMLGRVISIASVVAWSAIPLGSLAGGLLIERTGSVSLVYGACGALVFFIALAFSFTALGRADEYLPRSV